MLHNTTNQLAKLLATENIFVRHDASAKTASFDIKSRILTLPIFKKMSKSLTDMMVGHEVGHAIWTPADEWEAVCTGEDKVNKNILNIVEDPRIETKIQRKYPGLRACFVTGYRELFDQGFFGELAHEKRWDEMNILDRLNVHFKGGPSMGVKFASDEMYLVRLIEKVESFDDAVNVTKEIMKFWNESDQPEPEEMRVPGMPGDDESDGDGETIEVPMTPQEAGQEFDADEHEVDEDEVTTQSEYEARIDQMLDRQAYNRVYIGLPKANLSNVIIDWKAVNKELGEEVKKTFGQNAERTKEIVESYGGERDRMEAAVARGNIQWPLDEARAKSEYKTFRTKSVKIVNYMVKEFERKKAAQEYKRTSINKTGVLNVNALHSYKYNDDLFLKRAIVHDGKNHGLVMMVDWSASMYHILNDTIHQLMNLIWFCSKVNIPFEVYAFCSGYAYPTDENGDRPEGMFNLNPAFKFKHGDVWVGGGNNYGFRLLNLASSRQNAQQLTTSLFNMWFVGSQHTSNWHRADFGAYDLGSTPLVEAMIVMQDIIPKFKSAHKLDKVNFITLTDGEANSSFGEVVDHYREDDSGTTTIPHRSTDMMYQDPETRKTYNITKSKQPMRRFYGDWAEKQVQFLLTLMKDKYGINTIGIFLTDGKLVQRNILEKYLGWYSFNKPAHQRARKQVRTEGFATVTSAGYDEYYVIPTGRNQLSDDGMGDVDADISKAKLRKLFATSQKGKTGNRYLANRMMDLIV
jgi:hypothetical protein